MRFLYFIAVFFLTQQFSFYSSLRSQRALCGSILACIRFLTAQDNNNKIDKQIKTKKKIKQTKNLFLAYTRSMPLLELYEKLCLGRNVVVIISRNKFPSDHDLEKLCK